VKTRRGADANVRGEMTDDEDDDGRGLVSASWGTGHDGSAIEILNVQFVEVWLLPSLVERSMSCFFQKSRSIPGLRTRSQRLLEYAERRAGVLGLALSYARGATRLAGRKRRRGWDWPQQHFRHLPNANVLDVIPEQDEEMALVVDESVVGEDMRMNVHTVVFGLGPGGDVQAGCELNTFFGVFRADDDVCVDTSMNRTSSSASCFPVVKVIVYLRKNAVGSITLETLNRPWTWKPTTLPPLPLTPKLDPSF
jgi:hypothetical protein